MKGLSSPLLVCAFASILLAQTPLMESLSSMEGKLQHISANATTEPPDQTPTEITEQEANAWLASGRINLPAGVKSVALSGEPDVIKGTALVDFDEVRAGRSSYNPLLSVFTGDHNVRVTARAQGSGGEGFVHVEKVTLDDVEIPNFALQMFVEKYITPKYPNIGIDSRFPLPDRIDTAKVGSHKVTITQK